MSGKKEIEVELGDNGAGAHCDDQFMRYAGGGAVAGACFGAVEACLVNPVPGQATPLIFKAFRIMGTRSLLAGTVGGVFALGACFSAKLRDRDDYVNAVIGGMLAGSIFGYKRRSFAVGARMAAGMGALLGLIKFRTGSYLPPLVPQEESFEVRRSKRISSSR